MVKKRLRGRPRTQPPHQHVHLRLPLDLYTKLVARSRTTGIPQNTIIVRAIAAAFQKGVSV